MTDKEFKRLSRSQLVDIIYQLQLRQEELEEENRNLKKELSDKRIRMREAGNIAEASLAIHNVMQAAQKAADRYLEEIRLMHAEAAKKYGVTFEKVKPEVKEPVSQPAKPKNDYDSMIDAILKEYKQSH